MTSPRVARLRRDVASFTAARPAFIALATTIEQVLHRLSGKHGLHAIIQTRVKSVPGFAEKITRPGKAYADPVAQVTDICGVRLILPTLGEVATLCTAIEREFPVQWEHSGDTLERLSVSEFGYLSKHYIVQLPPTGSWLLEGLDVETRAMGLNAEIQVRTVLQHAWAAVNHGATYKTNARLPKAFLRRFYQVAAVLENVDEEFVTLLHDMATFSSNYGGYMDASEIDAEIDRLAAILEASAGIDRESTKHALQLAKLARHAGRWDIIIQRLGPIEVSGHADVLRELGIATCKINEPGTSGYASGQALLEKAILINPADLDALASLAGTWKRVDEGKAGELYRRAFDADPENTYAAGNHAIHQLQHVDPASFLPPMVPHLRTLVKKCDRQVQLDINVPWAHFDKGLFHLLLGEIDLAIDMYLAGARLASEAWMLRTTVDTLDRLPPGCITGAVDARDLLALAAWFRFADAPSLDRLAARPSLHDRFTTPVVVLAGSSAASNDTAMQLIAPGIVAAFKGWTGTLVSGGTRSGIGKIAGDVRQACPDTINLAGYVPASLPDGVEVDARYDTVHATTGDVFSIREPLQYWIDMARADVNARNVTVIGAGGGHIAGIEYRLALVFNARLVIIDGIPGEALVPLGASPWTTAPIKRVSSEELPAVVAGEPGE